jgi:hypothetical protein
MRLYGPIWGIQLFQYRYPIPVPYCPKASLFIYRYRYLRFIGIKSVHFFYRSIYCASKYLSDNTVHIFRIKLLPVPQIFFDCYGSGRQVGPDPQQKITNFVIVFRIRIEFANAYSDERRRANSRDRDSRYPELFTSII